MDFGSLFVPPELLTTIVEELSLTDIKSLRQVCHTISDVATQFLFQELYISCRLKDRENFTKVSEHPIFSQSVRRVIYDSTNISRAGVFQGHCKNKGSYARVFHPGGALRGGKEYTKAAVQRGFFSMEELYRQQSALAKYREDELTLEKDRDTRPKDFSKILRNVDRFPEVAKFLPDDLVRLVQGLPHMPNIWCFEVSDSRYAQNRRRYRHRDANNSIGNRDVTFWIKNEGTRGIDEVIIDPRPWPSNHEESHNEESDEDPDWDLSWYRGFFVLTQAASITKMKNPERFEVQRDCAGSGLPLEIFDMPSRQLRHTMNAFANLKFIELKISGPDQWRWFPLPRSALSNVLASAKQLEYLDFRLDESYETWQSGTLPFDQLFGDPYWPKLRQATFSNMSLSQSPFLRFFIKHHQTLRSLRLEQVCMAYEFTEWNEEVTYSRLGWILKSMALDGSVLSSFTFRSGVGYRDAPIRIHCCDAAAMPNFLKSWDANKSAFSCPQYEEHMWDEEYWYLK